MASLETGYLLQFYQVPPELRTTYSIRTIVPGSGTRPDDQADFRAPLVGLRNILRFIPLNLSS